MSTISFSGIASGLDTSSLIQSLLDQQRSVRVKPLETKVSGLKDSNTALSELKSLLNKLSDASQTFRAISGGAIRKNASTSDETVLGASASNSAQSGTHSVTVTQRAKNGTFSYNDRFTTSSTALNSSINDGAPAADRTVTYQIGTGGDAQSVSVVLTSATTAQDFITSFNSQTDAATASLVNVGTSGTPSYAIVINSRNEGTSKGTVTQTAAGSQLSSGSGVFQSSTVSQATDATLTVSGVSGTITRSSNTINDIIPGVTLSLQSLGTSQITIGADPDTTATAVGELVEAYNEVIRYIATNDSISQEQDSAGQTSNIFGPLATISLDESILSALRSALTSSSVSGGAVNTLADLGIATQRDGTLSFDSKAFSSALASDPSRASSILTNLGEAFGAVGGTISQFTRFNGGIDTLLNANNETISSLNNRISEAEKSLANQEQSLTRQYARLEGLVGKLTSQQSTLSAILPR